MDVFRIKSAKTDVAFEFSEFNGAQFRVTVSAHDHSATHVVYAYDPDGIARLFAEAARDWMGWDGVKRYDSCEGELSMQLHSDRSGHIQLKVRVGRDFGGPDPWVLDAELALEAGQLEAIARDAKRFWSKPS